MSIDHSEKRGFIRIRTDSPVKYKIVGTSDYLTAKCIDLSASGVRMALDHRVQPGTRMDIEINLKKSLVPSLIATVEVVRSQLSSDGGYQIGAEIIRPS